MKHPSDYACHHGFFVRLWRTQNDSAGVRALFSVALASARAVAAVTRGARSHELFPNPNVVLASAFHQPQTL